MTFLDSPRTASCFQFFCVVAHLTSWEKHFRVFSSFPTTFIVTGQSWIRQYAVQENTGALVLDWLVLILCLLNTKMQKGCTDFMPVAITLVHCRPWKSLPFCVFFFCHSFWSMTKKPKWLLWQRAFEKNPLQHYCQHYYWSMNLYSTPSVCGCFSSAETFWTLPLSSLASKTSFK